MPQQVELVRIKTTLGDRLYPVDVRIYSNVGPKGFFFREYIGDVQEGGMVLWHNESIDKTLEDIVPYLQQSPRYQRAKQAVFTANAEGVLIPHLRRELIHALAVKGVVSADDVQKKVMREDGNDFAPREYAAMAGFLHGELQRIAGEDNIRGRDYATIRQWLTGHTWGPQQADLFYSLALATGSGVLEQWWADSAETGGRSQGFWREYKFYIMLHRKLMKRLGRGDLQEWEAAGGYAAGLWRGLPSLPDEFAEDMEQEIQFVLNQFVETVDEKFSLARVIRAEKLSIDARELQHRKQQGGIRLADGAYTGNEQEKMTLLSLERMVDEAYLISYATRQALATYLFGVWDGAYDAPQQVKDILLAAGKKIGFRNQYGRQGIVLYLDDKLREQFGDHQSYVSSLSSQIQSLLEQTNKAIPSALHANTSVFDPGFSTLLADMVSNGTIDDALGLPPFLLSKAFAYGIRLTNSYPNLYRDFVSLKIFLMFPHDRKSERSFTMKYKDVSLKLRRKYNLDVEHGKSLLLEEFYRQLFRLENNVAFNNRSAREREAVHELVLLLNEENHEKLEQHPLVRRLGQSIGNWFTSSEAAHIMQAYGLEPLLQCIPAVNFSFGDAAKGAVP